MQTTGSLARFGTSRNHASGNHLNFAEVNPQSTEKKGFLQKKQPGFTRQMPEITHRFPQFSQFSGFRTQAPSTLPKLKTSKFPNEPGSAQLFLIIQLHHNIRAQNHVSI